MGTQKFGFLAGASLGFLAGTLGVMAAQRRRIDSLQTRVGQLEQDAESHRHANLATQQSLHWQLLSKAIDDPDLAEVLDVFESATSPQQRRQFLFANALYTNQVFAYRVGNTTLEEFFGFMRGLFQNPIMRDYWYAGRHQRATIDDDSDEAKLGHLVDDLLRQLEDADSEEWWVVGEPPTE
ncbi:DUF6082 family protein [Streptomyces althioticus]|uniref:DUF6082 family protein n=1 Tax=Streptomyces lusitanus TaxID=68232 RepID=UPI0021BF68BC|nr:DUF6082 family protein [Streptomyces lusitanus]